MGSGQLDFTFCNLAYAEGVKEMRYRLRLMKREECYILAEEMGVQGKATERAVCLEPLTLYWMRRSSLLSETTIADVFDENGAPSAVRLIRACS